MKNNKAKIAAAASISLLIAPQILPIINKDAEYAKEDHGYEESYIGPTEIHYVAATITGSIAASGTAGPNGSSINYEATSLTMDAFD